MHAMHLIQPTGRRRKWYLRLSELPGSPAIPAHRKKSITQKWQVYVGDLLDAYASNALPPKRLAPWIARLPAATFDALVRVGLLMRQQRQGNRPMGEHVDEYETAVANRRSNTDKHGRTMANRVRRLVRDLHISGPVDIDAGRIINHLAEWNCTDNTRRGYLIAVRNFCKWMVRDKRMFDNPLEHVELPAADADPAFMRRPLTVDEFRRLLAYMTTFERYPGQRSPWVASDRRILYWTAACSGLRQNELRTLRRSQLLLEQEPPSVAVEARYAKNRRHAVVPIPSDLAAALRLYTARQLPGARVFATMPSHRMRVVEVLRMDLAGAGIEWTDDMRVDFHSFRATAITWWFTEYKLSVREVAELARCLPRTSERYARNYRPERFEWRRLAPNLLAATPEVDATTKGASA